MEAKGELGRWIEEDDRVVQEEERMRISVIGLGFVGLVTATILADRGNSVTCLDIDERKINKLKKGDLYIYEPGLEDLFRKNRARMTFTSNYSLVKGSEIAFICVPTPTSNGRINLEYVRDSVLSLNSADRNVTIVIKSTVVPGTASSLSSLIGKDIISNPEFLREGNAIEDTVHPDRIVIGGKNDEDVERVAKIWEFTGAPILKTTNENAELIKYASNAFLATKISFINEIANLCEKIPGSDVSTVALGIGMDHRIGKDFLRSGIGFGGSCFPKDTMALVSFAEERGVDLRIVKSTIGVNSDRVKHAVEMIEEEVGNLKGKSICILGLSFKDNTNDLRESKSLELINELRARGCKIRAYDPVVKELDGVEILNRPEDCEGSDCVVIASEWKEFETNSIYGKVKNVIDLKNIVNLKVHPNVKAIGVYHGED
ncbi:MAG: UDP-glucose dehydrogenase family protein [Thermoplasmata archaeon]